MMNHQSITFAAHVTTQEILSYCDSMPWMLIEHFPAIEDQPEEYMWSTAAQVEVHFLNDPVLHRSRFVVIGDQTGEVTRDVTSHFDSLQLSDGIEMYSSATEWEDKVVALSVIAATISKESGSDAIEVVHSSLLDNNYHVRNMGVTTVFYAPSEDLIPAIKRITLSDPHPEVRRRAGYALEVLKANQRS